MNIENQPNIDTKKIEEIGVPRFLVNQWLNIQPKKSSFVNEENQVDDKEDVSVYSETTMSQKSILFSTKYNESPRKSKFSNAKFNHLNLSNVS